MPTTLRDRLKPMTIALEAAKQKQKKGPKSDAESAKLSKMVELYSGKLDKLCREAEAQGLKATYSVGIPGTFIPAHKGSKK